MQTILFKLLKSIQQTLIAKESIDEFKSQLQNLQQQNREDIFEIITQNELKNYINVPYLPNQFTQFKTRLREKYIGLFQSNFRQFLIKYNLVPCQKKDCKFLQLQWRFPDQDLQQYICLICFKKMCSQNCGKKLLQQKELLGNLTRHAMKRHKNKTMYLQISSSQILIIVAPLILYCNLTLFQNLIGQQTELGYWESSKYERFKLNLKVVDLIVDIVFEEKYINKLFADVSKIIKKYL